MENIDSNVLIEDEILENNMPTNPKWWSILAKLFIWMIIGLVFSALVFVMFVWLWSSIEQAVKNSASQLSFSPLVWLSFIAISTLTSIIWSIVIAGVYNVLWNDQYYHMRLMSSSILAVNLLLFIPFLILYFYAWTILSDMWTLFLIYWMHLFFSIFISFVSMDIIKNPNYSPVYLISNSFGFIITILIFFLIYSATKWADWAWIWQKNILFYPPILAFAFIPFFAAMFEKVYYKFYEMWNDFLYVPSIAEVLVDSEDVDEVNVDI